MLHHLSYSLVSRCLGILLLAAAGLKLNGLAVDPVGRMGLFSLPAFQIAVVELEIFLAIWLLWGWKPLGSWALAFVVFSAFAGVSAYQGWIGRATCGCFGRLSVNPWYAFGIDVGVLILLFSGRPRFELLRQQPRQFMLSPFRRLWFGGRIRVAGGFGRRGEHALWFRRCRLGSLARRANFAVSKIGGCRNR
jgi:hypothetical protein